MIFVNLFTQLIITFVIKFTNMRNRIQLFMKARNLNAAQLADEINVQKSGISHILTGRNNPSLDFIQKILVRFPEISAEWLIMGKGAMFQDNTLIESRVHSSVKDIEKEKVNDLFSSFEASENSFSASSVERDVKEFKEIESIKEENVTDLNSMPNNITMNKNAIQQPASDLKQIIFIHKDNSFSVFNPRD